MNITRVPNQKFKSLLQIRRACYKLLNERSVSRQPKRISFTGERCQNTMRILQKYSVFIGHNSRI